MKKWWAQYLESVGDIKEAINYYKLADDSLSLVRMYCFLGNMEEAMHLIDVTNNLAAAYHIGRYFEEKDQVIIIDLILDIRCNQFLRESQKLWKCDTTLQGK